MGCFFNWSHTMATKNNIKLGKQEENLSEANIKKVIGLLEPETGKPITKTLACQMLCISYNVKRLDTLITKYKDAQIFKARMAKEKRGTPATKDEIEYTIRQYMRGDPIAQISKDLFRSPQFLHLILDSHDVPRRPRVQDYFRPELVPESAVRESFEIGEKVYSARYDSLALIKNLFPKKSGGENVYSIHLLDEKWNMFAYQPASELASLESITKLGVTL
jgi:hypothetical protein